MLLQTAIQSSHYLKCNNGIDRNKQSSHLPILDNQYKKKMEGVDQADQNIATCWIAINTKKWWWAVVTWIRDLVLQDACFLYWSNRQPQDPNIDFLTWEIVDIYLKKYVCCNQSGRARGRILPARILLFIICVVFWLCFEECRQFIYSGFF